MTESWLYIVCRSFLCTFSLFPRRWCISLRGHRNKERTKRCAITALFVIEAVVLRMKPMFLQYEAFSVDEEWCRPKCIALVQVQYPAKWFEAARYDRPRGSAHGSAWCRRRVSTCRVPWLLCLALFLDDSFDLCARQGLDAMLLRLGPSCSLPSFCCLTYQIEQRRESHAIASVDVELSHATSTQSDGVELKWLSSFQIAAKSTQEQNTEWDETLQPMRACVVADYLTSPSPPAVT